MTLNALIVVFGLAAVLFLVAAARSLRRRRIVGGLVRGGASLVLVLIAACAALIAVNLRTYRQLTAEQPAGELQPPASGTTSSTARLLFPGERTDFALRGDEWQVDAHVLEWRALANLFVSIRPIGWTDQRDTQHRRRRSLPRVYALSQRIGSTCGTGPSLPFLCRGSMRCTGNVFADSRRRPHGSRSLKAVCATAQSSGARRRRQLASP
jgi:hypothetical protein